MPVFNGYPVRRGTTLTDESITITANGTTNVPDGKRYNPIITNVSGGLSLGAKSITQNGSYNATDDSLDGYSSVNVNVQASVGTGEFAVVFIDGNGTVLQEQHLNTGETAYLPSNPSYNGYTFHHWSAAIPILGNSITVTNNDIVAGAVYNFLDTKLYITLSHGTGKTMSLYYYKYSSNTDTIDWGDGYSTIVATEGENSPSHTYTNYGDYVITLTSNSSYDMRQPYPLNKAMYAAITEAHIGSRCTCINFSDWINLKTLIISNGLSDIMVAELENLKAIVFPRSVTKTTGLSGGGNMLYLVYPYEARNPSTITARLFSDNSMLRFLPLPSEMGNMGSFSILGGSSLTRFMLPLFSNSTTIRIESCPLKELVYPSSTTELYSIDPYMTSCIRYDFTSVSSVPTLSSLNDGDISGFNPITQILAPFTLYGNWILATNWALLQDFTIGVFTSTGSITVDLTNATNLTVRLQNKSGVTVTVIWDGVEGDIMVTNGAMLEHTYQTASTYTIEVI